MFDFRSAITFWRSKHYIGCDVGASSLKLVWFEKTAENLKLLNKGILDLSGSKDPEDRSEMIRVFMEENDFFARWQGFSKRRRRNSPYSSHGPSKDARARHEDSH